MEEGLLTTKEVSEILGISEDKVSELVEKRKIPAYKIGGIYLRFKREEIENLKDRFEKEKEILRLSAKRESEFKKNDWTFFQRIKDFFYFYDFYILSSLIILILLIFIFRR